jgi:hypothetical protein
MAGGEKVIRSGQALGFESFGGFPLSSFRQTLLPKSEPDGLGTLRRSRNSQRPGIGLRNSGSSRWTAGWFCCMFVGLEGFWLLISFLI